MVGRDKPAARRATEGIALVAILTAGALGAQLADWDSLSLLLAGAAVGIARDAWGASAAALRRSEPP